MRALDELLKKAGIPAQVIGEPPLFDVIFTDLKTPIRNYRDTLTGDTATMRRFNALVRARGILKGEQKYYVSLAHDDADVAFTIDAWRDAIPKLKA